MDKLQYDSLYKFLVSLGVVLIALPVAALIFLANGTQLIISQSEYEALSEYSIRNLEQRELIISLIIKFLPVLFIILCIAGTILIIVGLKKWYQIQKILDNQVAAETKIKELEAAKMSNVEMITEKIREAEEVSNSVIDSSNNINQPPVSSYSTQHQRLLKYAEIEDRFFEYGIPIPIKRRYNHKRNLRIGRFSYDAVAVSLKTNTDLIYEVKYWDRKPPNNLLRQTLERLHLAGVNYETEEHRNYHCILAIVAPQQITDSLMEQVETFIEKYPELNFSDIDIKYVAEESLTDLNG
ncbi:MAG: hypothetical protein IJW53_04135 [Clostridia bacterium]|nr:hypothetical protein [Clostridia bacterium]